MCSMYASRPPGERPTLVLSQRELDERFTIRRSLWQGRFSNLFYATRNHPYPSSYNHLVVKVWSKDSLGVDDQHGKEQDEACLREVNVLTKLKDSSFNNHVMQMVEWIIGDSWKAVIFPYVDGGSLADEITSRSSCDGQPYSERRIAWYALQLCRGLKFAHERGVCHLNVNSSNVLVTRGNYLVLSGFGGSIPIAEEGKEMALRNLNGHYLPPEAHQNLVEKRDIFGVGCIIYELLCCKMLVHLFPQESLAEQIMKQDTLDFALDSPNVKLRWNLGGATPSYSLPLRAMVNSLLIYPPSKRSSPQEIIHRLVDDRRGPLLRNVVAASTPPREGACLTIDNVQLGMFVQFCDDSTYNDHRAIRGQIGAITHVMAGNLLVAASFPSGEQDNPVKTHRCRIGANGMHDLFVAFAPRKTFRFGTNPPMNLGLVWYPDRPVPTLGQVVEQNIVVATDESTNRVIVVPTQKSPIWQVSSTPISSTNIRPSHNTYRPPISAPTRWGLKQGASLFLAEVDVSEKNMVAGYFTDSKEIISVKRVLDHEMWTYYATERKRMVFDNWVVNEKRLFCDSHSKEINLFLRYLKKQQQINNGTVSYRCGDGILGADRASRPKGRNETARTVILARVALGRVCHKNHQRCDLVYHSQVDVHRNGGKWYKIATPRQIYPEFLITFESKHTNGPSQDKLCVVCDDRPVQLINVPCGHFCFCQDCGHRENLSKMKYECPICRQKIEQTVRCFGGRVVDD